MFDEACFREGEVSGTTSEDVVLAAAAPFRIGSRVGVVADIRPAKSICGAVLLGSMDEMTVEEDHVAGFSDCWHLTAFVHPHNLGQSCLKIFGIVWLRHLLIDRMEVGTGDKIHAAVFLITIINGDPSPAQRIRSSSDIERILMIGLTGLLRRFEEKH